MRQLKFISLLFACLTTLSSAYAGVEIRKFSNFDEEQRYNQLIDELRCLVCQNQNLADSNSQLALDLRNRVHTMIVEGKSDQEITDYMVQRYGEFVLYNPPLDPVTAILWVGPFLFLFVGIFFLVFYIKKQVNRSPSVLSNKQHEHAKKLLDDSDKDNK